MTRRTVHGQISLDVDREHRSVRVEVPVGTQARALLPGIDSLLGPGTHTVSW